MYAKYICALTIHQRSDMNFCCESSGRSVHNIFTRQGTMTLSRAVRSANRGPAPAETWHAWVPLFVLCNVQSQNVLRALLARSCSGRRHKLLCSTRPWLVDMTACHLILSHLLTCTRHCHTSIHCPAFKHTAFRP